VAKLAVAASGARSEIVENDAKLSFTVHLKNFFSSRITDLGNILTE
jgi:hypothetical protein